MNGLINGAAAMKLTLLLVASLLVIVSLLLISPATIVGQEQGPAAVGERLAADTLETTVLGNPFVAPKDWSIRVKGPATILEAPEGGSWIALVDLQAKTADEALKAAWQAYRPEATWPVKVTNYLPDRDGWSRRRSYDYLTSPNEKRGVGAVVYYSGSSWTVIINDMADAVAEKRGGQVALVFGRLLPKGYSRESFAGKKSNKLDEARIAELGRFIERGERETGVPGVSLGLIQDGKVIFAGGFGAKELDGSEKPDGDTLFMIASNTKALTTLMLAKLVNEHRLTWDTPVTQLFPSFKLGDAETTHSVLVKHLICACTGMPRQDLEWFFEYGKMTPENSLTLLGTMRPTSKFGELFQYSNLMAAAAGYTGAHVLYPQMEVGAGYDGAMHEVRGDGTRRRQASRRNDLYLQRAFAGEAQTPGLDGQGQLVWHGLDGGYDIRSAYSPSRRGHDRVSQRHDLAAGAERGRGGADEWRSRLDNSDAIPAQAARGIVRWTL